MYIRNHNGQFADAGFSIRNFKFKRNNLMISYIGDSGV